MPKQQVSKNRDFTLLISATAIFLVVLMMLLGWLMAGKLNPLTINSASNHSYLIYRTYRVLSRGLESDSAGDSVLFEFFRYSLDGTTNRGESIQRIQRSRADEGVGIPWMRQVSDDTLLFARRDTTSDAVWIDVSNKIIRTTADETPDVLWNGLPSPDNDKIVYYDWPSGRVVIMNSLGLRSEYDLGKEAGVLMPILWDKNSTNVFLKTVTEGNLSSVGLWQLNIKTGTANEIEPVKKLKLYDFDIDSSTDYLIGATFHCENLDECGTGPSMLYSVDLKKGFATELYSDKVSAFGHPKFSPDASKIAYTLTSNESNIWIADLNLAGHERRIISGSLVDWTPDGKKLVVWRDNELQLVSIDDLSVTTIAQRSGQYQDADFYGVDYIGIVKKK